MKYFVSFKNNKVSCSWERETDTEHPSYIKKDDIYEVTEEQYSNHELLSLNAGEVVFDTTKKAKKDRRQVIAGYRAKMQKLRELEDIEATLDITAEELAEVQAEITELYAELPLKGV